MQGSQQTARRRQRLPACVTMLPSKLTQEATTVLVLAVRMLLLSTCITDGAVSVEEPLRVRQRANNVSAAALPCYVLSLPQSGDRRVLLEPVLRKHASNMTLVQPYDGRKKQQTPLAGAPANCNVEGFQHFNITLSDSCAATKAVQLAVAVSHLKAVFEAYTAGEEAALILEDDMHVLRWPAPGLIFTAPPDWDVLLLYMMGTEAEKLYKSPPSLWVPWRSHLYSAGAYIIHRAAMLHLLDAYMPGAAATGKIQQLDLSRLGSTSHGPLGCQSERVLFSVVKTYICTDFTIVEHSGESTLDRDHRAQHDSTAALVQHILSAHGFTLLY